MSACILPVILSSVLIISFSHKTDIYSVFLSGAKQGLSTVYRIFPSILAILTGIYMLRASGFLSALTDLLLPVFTLLGLPAETSPLILIRPLSGSAALAVASDIINECGPDSVAGKTAAVMMGSTETTFYTAAVYLGACGVKKSRYAIPAALFSDFIGFITAAFTVRLMFF